MEQGRGLDLSFDLQSIKFQMDVRLWLRNIAGHLASQRPLQLLVEPALIPAGNLRLEIICIIRFEFK